MPPNDDWCKQIEDALSAVARTGSAMLRFPGPSEGNWYSETYGETKAYWLDPHDPDDQTPLQTDVRVGWN